MILKKEYFFVAIAVLMLSFFGELSAATKKKDQPKIPVGLIEREYLVNTLIRIADPVLEALSKNHLKERMPVESAPNQEADRRNYTYLEAFGRTLAGMAPWLELGPDDSPEGKLREKYILLAVQCIRNATNPATADFMNFTKGGQPLVDAGFLSQALLRAPTQLWGRLNEQERTNLTDALKSTRVITPGYSNWLLFSAEVEAALLKFTGSCDRMRIDYAVKEHMNWYKGDGIYGDGPNFHYDYYNSFVIQPMLLEVLQTLKEAGDKVDTNFELAFQRSRRYAAIQERLISPEGTYPVTGRSIAYRFGAFQVLAKMAQLHALPDDVSPQQVRSALYTLIKRQIEMPGTFDEKGWLTIGVAGHQPKAGEVYISTGSLYLCTEGLLMLGLPATDPFWQGDDEKWTSKKVWDGEDFPIDHALQ
ncbi:MAG TPA: DUF2264 domain-containing protein [Prolixibacteraceae bacterium]|jgi:hypothetical protein